MREGASWLNAVTIPWPVSIEKRDDEQDRVKVASGDAHDK